MTTTKSNNISERSITSKRLLFFEFETDKPKEEIVKTIIAEAMNEISKIRVGSQQGKKIRYVLNYNEYKGYGNLYLYPDCQDVAYMLIGFDWNGDTREVPDKSWKPPCPGEVSQLRRELMYTDRWGDIGYIEVRLEEVNRKELPMITTNEPIYKIKHKDQVLKFVLAWNYKPSSDYEGNILTNPKPSFNLKKIRPDQEKVLIEHIKTKYGSVITKHGFQTVYKYDKKLRRKVEVKEDFPIIDVNRKTGRLSIIYENETDSILGLIMFDKIEYNGEMIKFWYNNKKGYDNIYKKKYKK